ncbi:hypothetical protein HK103_004187 [Boothiomyces macroporosus]|uniref:DNL-type domain-containing protein n=1 Tax=Boothiomyces macroporosus TaxID=261099 RepID=A0AAD5UGX6_9FUNG|nr:hypothetical protein HK103_004187 [Boothiomyces macroporosus]
MLKRITVLSRAIKFPARRPVITRYTNIRFNSTTPQDRLIIGFTCKVCNHRQFKSMSKLAYTKGVVMIKCDGCKNTHLIADHLGWFDSQSPPGTIEDILKAKGESVKRVQFDPKIKGIATTGDEADAVGMEEFIPKVIDELEK